MAKSDFEEFVKRQQTAPLDGAVDWDAQRSEWLNHLDQLYEKIESFLEAYLSSGGVQREYQEILLNERDIGSYAAKKMILRIGRQEISFTPIGTLLIGSKGRVDVLGSAGSATLILVDKKAISPRSLIRVTVRTVGGPPPAAASQPLEPIEWEWRIFSRPPEMKFIDLTQDTFFEMILEVANA